jgi:hypothetical protein
MIIPIFSAYIEKDKGIIKIRNRERFDLYCASLKPGDYDLIIKRKVSKRSDQQNKYYWGVVLEVISESTGYTPDELHDTFRAMFLMDKSGKWPIIKSTTSLNKVTFGDYLEKIFREAAKLGIVIPGPDDTE